MVEVQILIKVKFPIEINSIFLYISILERMANPEVQKLVWHSIKEIGKIPISFDCSEPVVNIKSSLAKLQKLEKELQLSVRKYGGNVVSQANQDRLAAALATVQLYVCLMKMSTGKMKPQTLDYNELRRILKECLRGVNQCTSELIRALHGFYCQKNYSNIPKVLILIYAKSLEVETEMVKKGFKSFSPEEYDFEPKYLKLRKMEVFQMKLQDLESNLCHSAAILEYGPEIDHFNHHNDEKEASRLLEIIQPYENDMVEFAEAPGRYVNYEEAEKTSKLISKLCRQRLDYYAEEKTFEFQDAFAEVFQHSSLALIDQDRDAIYRKKNILNENQYYSGLIYGQTAKFITDESLKYKMLLKSFKNWKNLEQNCNDVLKM